MRASGLDSGKKLTKCGVQRKKANPCFQALLGTHKGRVWFTTFNTRRVLPQEAKQSDAHCQKCREPVNDRLSEPTTFLNSGRKGPPVVRYTKSWHKLDKSFGQSLWISNDISDEKISCLHTDWLLWVSSRSLRYFEPLCGATGSIQLWSTLFFASSNRYELHLVKYKL